MKKYDFNIPGFKLINGELALLKKKYYEEGLSPKEKIIQDYLNEIKNKLLG
jgi:hypothetical protein